MARTPTRAVDGEDVFVLTILRSLRTSMVWHKWTFNRTMLQLLGVRQTFLDFPLRRRLLLQPANIRKETEGPSFSFYLQTKQPCPSISATFQLWLVNQQDPKKTIQKGAVKGFVKLSILVSAWVCTLQKSNTALLKMSWTGAIFTSLKDRKS